MEKTEASQSSSPSENARRNIARLRRSFGWTLEAFANELSEHGHPISISGLSKIERGGRKNLDAEDLYAIAKVFGVSLDTLLEDDNDSGAMRAVFRFEDAISGLRRATYEVMFAARSLDDALAASDEHFRELSRRHVLQIPERTPEAIVTAEIDRFLESIGESSLPWAVRSSEGSPDTRADADVEHPPAPER